MGGQEPSNPSKKSARVQSLGETDDFSLPNRFFARGGQAKRHPQRISVSNNSDRVPFTLNIKCLFKNINLKI
ncbi:MAG: hypothetical protein COX39_01405 [Candidatus Nealsonbacteria bacterium CG23_combo_of_CG06-09_8_20_14_all_40_13]|uniref:Uncharacterized protein n=1 Tax=Candidatus Nealsonbacteria bacterium CG23_combo_of_CG06-09_8_20_14_all_40_13 TaxID=1974724 RepID=A0A2G9YR79_9BACT|nr:MAG: hypothetical protein COX39_01405 [Candidatus Nealsonbacteria bacterium CG23_combo_of_CG06-09_8_20_14_all_40_13]PIR71297.1 MAG: hypothetical protein COU44_00265 [Candidatus Nealsonbacteria bacterium CG10_big_fil_rev_8_21_14_0_10_40_24]PIU43248.1 MAG: hypothetical protein COS97_02020 [Candidatus Nealsonbacteria bacterium CG07_land_8_20_14_0_80_40_10]